MGEKLNKMTYPTYPNYPIYDLNDRDAATPVNIKELEEEDEAEIQLLAHNHESYESYDESYEAANKNSFVGTEETVATTITTTRRLRVAAFILSFLFFGGLIGWAVSTYVDTTENERASFTRKEYFHVLKHEFFPEGNAGVQPGVIVPVDTELSSESSIEMWTFIRLFTPVFNGGALYEPIQSMGAAGNSSSSTGSNSGSNSSSSGSTGSTGGAGSNAVVGINSSWTEMISEIHGDKYMIVYRLQEPLQPVETAPPLMAGLRMVDMSIKDFADIGDNIEPELKAYVANAGEGSGPDEAWNTIMVKYSEEF